MYSGVNCVRQCPLFCANGEYEIHKESRILLILLIWSPLISCNLDADYWRSSDLKIST